MPPLQGSTWAIVVVGVTIVETATATTGTPTGTEIATTAEATATGTGTGIVTITAVTGIGAIAAAPHPQKVEDTPQNTGAAEATLGAPLPEAAAHLAAQTATEGTTTLLLRPPLLLPLQRTLRVGEGPYQVLSVLPLLADANLYRSGMVWNYGISFVDSVICLFSCRPMLPLLLPYFASSDCVFFIMLASLLSVVSSRTWPYSVSTRSWSRFSDGEEPRRGMGQSKV